MKKYFVLDTNVLLHNSESIVSFADNIVVLPMTVIEELDRFKSHNDELGRNARKVIRSLDCLRNKGRLGKGVDLENGGILMIFLEKDKIVDIGMDMNGFIWVTGYFESFKIDFGGGLIDNLGEKDMFLLRMSE